MVERIIDAYPRTYFLTGNNIIEELQKGLYQAIADEDLKAIRSYSANLTYMVNGKIPPSRSRDFYSGALDSLRYDIAYAIDQEEIKQVKQPTHS